MYRFKVLLAVLALLAFCQIAVADSTVTFYFNPADFFDYRPLSGMDDTWSYEGGMFKLHKIWEGSNQYRSWMVSDRLFMENWANCLGANEGIGYFNIDLYQTGNGQFWGQTMQTPLSLDEVFAPAGWTTEISGLYASWTATSDSLLINPDTTAYDDDRSFGFRFTVSDCCNYPVPIGEERTVWFGGYNWSGYMPSLKFDQWGTPESGAFASIDAQPGTGFEATLKLVSTYTGADFDEDGDVDGNDFLIWQSNYSMSSGAAHTDGDANNDGKVDDNDLSIWQGEYGSKTPNPVFPASPIPEPSTICLGIIGIILTFGMTPRKRFRS
ncbi:MAG: hypothetical protein JW829_12185 [Pirellulales bacterium]|nr:hypothetical protein [Pirellulales bacterium]